MPLNKETETLFKHKVTNKDRTHYTLVMVCEQLIYQTWLCKKLRMTA